MALAKGTRLGPYQIDAAIGAGGMGEVYRARDTRLDRIVAVKVLAASLASTTQFRTRFANEARAISSLDHPHICALYDVGEQDGTAYIVMQYLEGETLATRLARGAVGLPEALRAARQICDALATAHRAGIVHRDLKPGNIMLTKSGAKLLDFGLARGAHVEVTPTSLSAATTAPELTTQGTILGTLHYMAPEQLEGKTADARTDIFAFGVVLYEMLTGHKAFDGKTQASLIAAILDKDPAPLSALQPLAPPAVERLVKICLAKDPDSRWQNAADLTQVLDWIAGSPESQSAAPDRIPRRTALTWGAIGLLAGSVIVAVLALVLAPRLAPSAQPSSIVRSVIDIAPADQLRSVLEDQTTSNGHPSKTTIALSPDGQTIVFSAIKGDRQQLYARSLAQWEAMPLPGTEDGNSPFFSPDGQWVGFWARGALKKVALDGDSATTICEAISIFGASWGPDDAIVFGQVSGGLWQVSASGGKPVALTTLDAKAGEVSHRLPHFLPGTRVVMFTVTKAFFPTWEDTEVVTQSLDGGPPTRLMEGAADARYLASGHLVYARNGTLNAVPFDIQRLRVIGGGVTLVPDLMQAANMPNTGYDSGAGQFSVSANGSLAYLRGGTYMFPERDLVWVDRAGRVEVLAAPPRAYAYPRLSPDGTRILVSTQGDRNLWLYDIARRTSTRLTFEGRNLAAIWTPDSSRITFGSSFSGQENIFWKPADGSTAAERITDSPEQQRVSSWSPDGRTLLFVQGSSPGGNGRDILVLNPNSGNPPQPLFATQFDEMYAEFSPDGRWIAYASNESGRSEVYVAPYPGPGPKVAVSVDGGHSPAWARTRRELLYLKPVGSGGGGPYDVMTVPVTIGESLSAGQPRKLFSTPLGLAAQARGYDVSVDGTRLLMIQPRPRTPLKPSQIVFVQNWHDELRRRVPSGNRAVSDGR